MKKILLLLSLSLTTLYASDDVKTQAINVQIQQSISQKILDLQAVDTSAMTLSEFILQEEQRCLDGARDQKTLIEACLDNSEKMHNIGDLETVLDLTISELTEYQTSFIFTVASFDEFLAGNYTVFGGLPLFILCLPFTVALDIVTAPLWLFILYQIG